jgi:hypothetical protein
MLTGVSVNRKTSVTEASNMMLHGLQKEDEKLLQRGKLNKIQKICKVSCQKERILLKQIQCSHFN